jgi:hypothetical protein
MKRIAVMAPAMVLVVFVATGMASPTVGGRSDDGTEAPRARELQAPRAHDEPQAPRSEDVQAPRTENTQAPRTCQARQPRWRED